MDTVVCYIMHIVFGLVQMILSTGHKCRAESSDSQACQDIKHSCCTPCLAVHPAHYTTKCWSTL